MYLKNRPFSRPLLNRPLLNRRFFLGADPGLTGAVVIIDPSSGPNGAVEVLAQIIPMPICQDHGGKKHVDPFSLARALDTLAPYIINGFVESVHAMPNQGVVSMFNFGRSCGAVHGVLAALSIPYMMTRPEVWKSALGLGRDKQESLKLAKSLWPEHAHLWALRKNDGIAEAALLAHYCIKATRNEGDDFGELI